MCYVTTPAASRLTGLSVDKLREWTSRRALVPADIRPKKKGSPAQFSWQTILVLRIAVTLRERFHLELQAHKTFLSGLRRQLRSTSFVALWGQTLALLGDDSWKLINNESEVASDDAVLLRLDPHLAAISAGFALPNPSSLNGQLDLFSLPAVHGAQRGSVVDHISPSSTASGRRRSA
ncbi:MerR family transcriptional regulator [Methylocaldum marinum]|uniref:MerR family transcriptional regulator n=1 Tax=Methylocaldum marinum TaxID=1432792 RepID=UPI000E6A8A0D|nr:hypothetical protein [Methylocaldum marinum]